MDGKTDGEIALQKPIAAASPAFYPTNEEFDSLVLRMKALLTECDSRGFQRAGAYLSMAIDRVEADISAISK